MSARQIPVFAFPNTLKFFLNTKSTHTQTLSLYSPFDFPVKFTVSCNSSAWEKYTVTNPHGDIPPQSTVDLIVTHKQPIPSNCNVIDKFKVVILDHVTDQVIGRKYIESILLSGEKDHRSNEDEFEFASGPHSDRSSVRSFDHRIPPDRANFTTPNHYILGVIGMFCAVTLFLPTYPEQQPESSLPNYLHVSHKLQLLAAVLIGVLLCIIIRS